MQEQNYPRKTGNDRILRKDGRLIICSKADMKDWHIQSVRKTVVCVDDEWWQLTEKRQLEGKEFRYYLDPWIDAHKEIPGRTIRYDEAYVQARDEADKRNKHAAAAGTILHCCQPLLGFLPSKRKTGLETAFGIPSRSITLQSLIIELLLFFVAGAFLQIFTYGAMRAPQLVVFIPFFFVTAPVLALDIIMRYHSYLRDDPSPCGFYEWLLPKRKKCRHSSRTNAESS